MAEKGKKKHRIGKWIACLVLVIIPCWIFVGGIDCEPPDDSDLLLPQSDEPYTDEGNGWTILSNVLSRVEAIEEEPDSIYVAFTSVKEKLAWYVNPNDYDWVIAAFDDASLSCFTNVTTACSYVETCMKSNEWIFAEIDSALAAPKYIPPPPIGFPFNEPCMEGVVALVGVHRSFLSARVKCGVARGNFDAAIEYYARSLRLGTLLQTHCQNFLEYLVGTATIGNDVALLERMMDEGAIPVERLLQFDELLASLPGVSRDGAVYALKREYARVTGWSGASHADVVFPDGSAFAKFCLTPIARYAWHPNRTLGAQAEIIRNAIQDGWALSESNGCRHCKRARSEKSWLRFFTPNWHGRGIGQNDFVVDFNEYDGHVRQVARTAENVVSLRRKIAERVAVAQTNGTIAASGQYFPLVFTNGCYYTSDMNKIIGVGTGPVVVGSDVEISASFGNIKTIVIPPGCTNCLNKWRGAFTEPYNLQEIVGAENHPEIGVSGSVVYDRRTKCALNLIGNDETVVIPKGVAVWDRDLLECGLLNHGASSDREQEAVQGCGEGCASVCGTLAVAEESVATRLHRRRAL